MIFTLGKLHDPLLPKCRVSELTRFGGRHPMYDLPLFRLVWGQKRLHWVGGKFENEVNAEGRHVPVHITTKLEPRYFGPAAERWILERWIPTTCSREQWEETTGTTIDGIWVDQLGPYPKRGDYEEVVSFPFEAVNSPELFEYTLRAVRMTQEISHSVRRAAILGREEKREKDWNTDADAILSDVPASYMRPSITVPSNYKESHE